MALFLDLRQFEMLSEIKPPLQNGIWQFFFNCNCSSLFKFQPKFGIVLQPKSEVSNLQLAFGKNHNCLLSFEFTVLIEFFISFLFGAELKETWDKSGKNGFCACLLVLSQNFLWQEKWWMVVCSVFFSLDTYRHKDTTKFVWHNGAKVILALHF